MVALMIGVYYLFEENAFLRAQRADPALVRAPGARHQALEIWSSISSCRHYCRDLFASLRGGTVARCEVQGNVRPGEVFATAPTSR